MLPKELLNAYEKFEIAKWYIPEDDPCMIKIKMKSPAIDTIAIFDFGEECQIVFDMLNAIPELIKKIDDFIWEVRSLKSEDY